VTSALASAIARAEAHSPFLRGLLRREPELMDTVGTAGFEAAIAQAVGRMDPERPAPSLRQARSGVALVTALGDLSGAWALERVTSTLTDFADRALRFAIQAAFAERECAPAGLCALALGKMGSGELNYSSDIDLIFIHDPEKLPHRSSEDPTEAAVRLVRKTAALLSERTADGYALRVDLRLRPDPDSTPSSLPVAAAEHYYQSQALAWERSAFIRARASAGDLQLGQDFLAAIAPFIWRRSLDYSALADIGEISHQIRDHFSEGQKLGPGFDLKRGRGGIREVEFFAQIHQLIFGGRDESLRAPATLDALAALAKSGKIQQNEAEFLQEAYREFRTLEHRLQMLGDQQTHSIPKLAADRAAVAGLSGDSSWRSMEGRIGPLTKGVAKLYDRLLETGDENARRPRIPHPREGVEHWAAAAKVKDGALLATLLDGWRSGRPRSLRAPESRRAFELVIAPLVQKLGAGRDGREGLLRLDQMINALPSGVQFWRLLAAHPALATVVGRLLTTTPLLADALARRPDLLDVVLQPQPPLDVEAAHRELANMTVGHEGEALLDRVRLWTAERRFLLGVQLLDQSVTPEVAARSLAAIAEAGVARLADAVATDFARKHGNVAGGRLVVLALGRFGGGELTAQSDLDLVLLFTGSFDALSDGPATLAAASYFNRLGQRLIAALSVPTAAGMLYEVDTRLRPSGAQGLLAVSVDSFLAYQQGEAELWETMALSRARPISGTQEDKALVQSAIDGLIARPRNPETVRREAATMRRLIAKHKPPAGPFDVKLMKGGLVDLEFIIQARALLAAKPVPAGLVQAASLLAPELASPARLLMDLLVMLRLIQPHDSSAAPNAAAGTMLAQACGKTSFAALKADLALAKQAVNAAWAQTFD